MSRNSKTAVWSILGLTVLSAACAKPPEEAIAAARAAEESAQTAEAAEYAPEALSAVADARAALDAELAAQGERMAVRRSYDRTNELAAAYRTAAEQAATSATSAKEQMRLDIEARLAAARTALDETTALLAAAPAGKGSRADLAALRTDLETAALGLTEATAAFDAGHFTDAGARLDSAVEIVERVRSAVDTARQLSRS